MKLNTLPKSIVLWAVLWAVSTGAYAGGTARLEEFLASTTTFSSTFIQLVYDEQANLLEDSSGSVDLERPNRFRWAYLEPFEQQIVADGERVWIYDADLEQVSVKPMDGAMAGTPALLLSSDRPVTENFALRDLGENEGVDWVELTPLSEDATFAHIRVGFSDDLLKTMELRDNFGQTTMLYFADIETNARIDPTVFEFTPPPGADVIGELPPIAVEGAGTDGR